MIDLQAIQYNVRLLLTKYPWARNLKTRRLAIYQYYQEFEGIGEFGISKREWLRITNAETISRAIRKCQELYPDLRPSPEEQLKRYETANKFAEFHKPKIGGIIN